MTILVAVDGSSLNEGLKRNSHLSNDEKRLLIDYKALREFLEGEDAEEDAAKAISRYYVSNPVLSSEEMDILEGWQKEEDRLRGTVIRFKMDGFGFIREMKTGNEYFVHFSDIDYCASTDVHGNGFKTLQVGEQVSFVLGKGEKGTPVAKHVRSNPFYQLTRQMFFGRVKDAGFEIVATRTEAGAKKCKSVDVQIAIDALTLLTKPHEDEFVLVSDDIDYLPLVKALMEKGINVTVVAFADKRPDGRSHLPKEFEKVAYDVLRLEEHLKDYILDESEEVQDYEDGDEDKGDGDSQGSSEVSEVVHS